MRGLWPWSGCVGSLITMMFTRLASGTEVGEGGYEIDWVEKVYHTLELVKRKQTCALTGFTLCASTLGGGCCPSDYECGTSSCFATTAGPSVCHGKPGWYGCDPTVAAGLCCPQGYICSVGGGCGAPAGLSLSLVCDNNGIRCPFSLGGGCCSANQVCGNAVCYDTTPKTGTISETTTITDSRGQTITTVVTSLTTYTDGPNASPGLPSATGYTQMVATIQPKIEAIGTDDDDDDKGSSLTPGVLGGIIGGSLVILGVILAATIFVTRRLRRTERAAKQAEKAAADRKSGSPNSQDRSDKSGYKTNISEIASNMETDPDRLIIMGNSAYSPRSRSTTIGTDRTQSNTPNFTSTTSSPPPHPPSHQGVNNAAPYAPSRPSESRQSSFDSYARHGGTSTTTPPGTNNRISHRMSVDSAGTYPYTHGHGHGHGHGHARQPSGASELEASQPVVVKEHRSENSIELEAARRRSESLTRPGPKPAQVRRNSDQNRPRGDSAGAGAGAAGAGGLRTVNEAFEMHGHYGPSDAAVGQTLGGADGSSPTCSNP